MGLKPKPDWLGADPELEHELKEVERRIVHQASLFDSGAEAYVRYALEVGKRLRPALVLLAGKVAGVERGDSGLGCDCGVGACGLVNS